MIATNLNALGRDHFPLHLNCVVSQPGYTGELVGTTLLRLYLNEVAGLGAGPLRHVAVPSRQCTEEAGNKNLRYNLKLNLILLNTVARFIWTPARLTNRLESNAIFYIKETN
jgi:hypothetical protein